MFYKHEDAVRVLMRNGADPTNLDSSGLSPNDIALAQKGYSRASPPDSTVSSDHMSLRRRRKAGLEGGSESPGRQRLLDALKKREAEQLRTAERRREAAQLREQQESEARRAEDMERLRRKHERRQDLQATLRTRSPLLGGGQGLGEISSVSAPPRDDTRDAPDVSAISFADSVDGDMQQVQSAAAEYDARGGGEEDLEDRGDQKETVIYCERPMGEGRAFSANLKIRTLGDRDPDLHDGRAQADVVGSLVRFM